MIAVLRLGHRIERDKRLTMHCALVARAFGSKKMFYTGDHDRGLEDSVRKVSGHWGGDFEIEYAKNPKKLMHEWKGKTVHLTMYGIPLDKKIRELRRKNLLVVVGGEQVPGEVYKICDYNISVTLQPHSEASSLAVFLHEYFQGKELNKKFAKAKKRIVPQERGKKIIDFS